MKRSIWVRLIAVILVISMVAAPVSAASNRGNDIVRTNGLIGFIVEIIRDIIDDIFDKWFDEPGDEDPVPTDPIETTAPTAPGETDPTEPGDTNPTEPGETKPTTPGVTEPGETDPTNPGETDPTTPDETEPGETEPEEEDAPEYELNLIEGHANTENGQLLRGVTYSLSEVIAQQSEPLRATTSQKGQALTSPFGKQPAGLTPLKSLSSIAAAPSVQPMAATQTTISETPLEITSGIPNGKYLIRYKHDTLGRFITNSTKSGSPWGTIVLLGTHDKNAATPFTFTRQADGTYAIQGPAGNYMNIERNKGNIITDANYFALEIKSDGIWLKDTNSNEYINVLGASEYDGEYFGGYSSGSPLELYEVTTTIIPPTEPDQPALGSEVVFFPVTMFNYNEAIFDKLTHQMDLNDDPSLTEWKGFYFNNGNPGAESYTGKVPVEEVDHYELLIPTFENGVITNIEDGEKYILVNKVGTTAVVDNENNLTRNPVTISNGTIAKPENNAVIWTITAANGGFQITGSESGRTLKFGNGSGVTDTTGAVTEIISWSADPNCVMLKQGSQYLNLYGGTSGSTFAGYGSSTDTGSVFYIYKASYESEVTVSNIPFAKWNFWSYLSGNNQDAQNKFYTGLVQDELDENNEIVFNVNEPGIFTFDKDHPEIINDGKKDIYQYVGMPFIKENGKYTFDSDSHGTYFADTTGDGVSDPWYGSADDYFNMYFEYGQMQGWDGMGYGDGSSHLWAPYNTNENDSGADNIDYHFGMRADLPFSMTPNGCIDPYNDESDPITFSFSGDDDVWVFIDGHLVIDLGGLHNRLKATINFAENTITYERPEENTQVLPIGSFNNPEDYPLNEDGTITVKLYDDANGEGALGQTRGDFSAEVAHEMTIFYLERGKGASNCMIEFNLPTLDAVMVTKDITKSWSAEQDENDGPDRDGTAPLTASEQAAVNKETFAFKLWKKELRGMFTPVANTRYYLMDKDGNILDRDNTTNAEGIFYLKNGQTAKFLTELGTGTYIYCVEELGLDLNTYLTPDYNYKGQAVNGFTYTGETLDPDSDDDNTTIPVPDTHVPDASQIPEQELAMNAERLLSYEIIPHGSIEAIETLEFICTNYLNAALPNPTARGNEDMIVIDYGLPVEVDPLANDVFRGNDIEIVAWGDESLTLNEILNGDHAVDHNDSSAAVKTSWSGDKVYANVTAAQLINDNDSAFNGEMVSLEDCLYTFTATDDGFYEVSATAADGTKVYLNHFGTSGNTIPNITAAGKIDVQTSSHTNMFKLLSKNPDGSGSKDRGLHFHSEKTLPHWNRCDGDTSVKCHEYLYRPVREGEKSSAEIMGYVLVTNSNEIVNGGQYLIVHKNDAKNLYLLHPANSNNQYDHIAMLTPATQVTTTVDGVTETVLTNRNQSFAFDSGNVTFNDVTYTEHKHVTTDEAGNETTTYTFDRDTFDYELTEQLTEVEVISYIIKVTGTLEQEVGGETIIRNTCRYALAKVYIAPATIMYYEENFSDMIFFEGEGWNEETTVSNQDNVSAYQEHGVVGTVGDSTYGSDAAYLNDNGDSNGTHRFGNTTNKAIRFTYTFTGTGTSIFARTSDKTGYMRVQVYTVDENNEWKLQSTTYRDTYWKDENDTNLDSTGTLYNIPVFTEEFQDYGTYKIVCTVAKKGTFTAGNENGAGNEFYLDGIRIMQPLNEDSDAELVEKALNAYITDGEANLDTVTLRYKLITDAQINEKTGRLYWDNEHFAMLTDIKGNLTSAEKYKSIGPKEEVYLAPGQRVSFTLRLPEPTGLKVYMGMKAPFGSAKVNVGTVAYPLSNAPDCYYDVTSATSMVTKYEQATNEDGYLLFLAPGDKEVYQVEEDVYYYSTNHEVVPADTELEPIYGQVTNEDGYLLFLDPDDKKVYQVAENEYYYSSDNQAVPAGTELEPIYDQVTNEDGYPLFLDPNGNEVYYVENRYYYSSDDQELPADTELEPIYDQELPYYLATFTFEAVENIVSLTNIKVVGQYEFTIVENTDPEVDGSVGED